jgi:Galactose oxidase, central domain
MRAGIDTRGRDAAAALRDLVDVAIDDVDIDESFAFVTGQRGKVIPLVERTRRSRRPWTIAIASTAAAAILVTTFILRSGTDGQEPVSPPPTTIAVPFDPVIGVFEGLGELDNGARFPVALPDGTVLVFGGAGADRSVLAFDPVTGRFTPIGSTTISLSAEPLPLLDGRVLLAGYSDGGGYDIELFDPTSGQSTQSGYPSGPPVTARVGNAAVQLADGRVLLLGGESNGATATTEIFDPTTQTYSTTGSMMRPRGIQLTATLLTDGRVLVAGGSGVDQPDTTAELYDPTTGTFTETGPMSLPRSGHTATILPDGRVLFTGGYTAPDAGGILTNNGIDYLAPNGDVYDPATGTFTPTGPMQLPRFFHVAALLRDGRVLIAGGNGADYLAEGVADAEIFDPATNQFSVTGSMTSPRQNAGAAVLTNGDVVVVGTANFAGGPRPPDDPTEIAAEIFR